MRKLLICLLFILGCVSLISCGTSTDDEQSTGSIEFGQDGAHLVNAHNQFGFELFSDLKQRDDDNLFFSPTSIMIALAMVMDGAQELTKEEIAEVLNVEQMGDAQLHDAIASLMHMLYKETDDIVLKLANSIWLHDAYHFTEPFQEHMTQTFKAHIQSLNLQDHDSVTKINQWVTEATEELIEEMIEAPIDPDMVTILLNAIYFNGAWTHSFNEALTKEDSFHVSDSEVVTVPFMELFEKLAYMENEVLQMVSLPYGDDEMSMYIMLPHEQVAIDEFDNLTYEQWLSWQDSLQTQEGTIRLPKFKIATDLELNDTLQSLGIITGFDPDQADFSLMIQEEDPVWISRIKHKAVLDVNERGTEAAGVTSVEMKTTSAPIEEPFLMEVDRPFFLLIVDEATDTILFIGKIANPIA